MIVEESIHIVFDETNDLSSRKKDFSDDDVEIIEKEMKKLNLRDNANLNEEDEVKDDDQENNLEENINKEHDDLSKE